MTTVVVCAAAFFALFGVDRATFRTTLRGADDTTFFFATGFFLGVVVAFGVVAAFTVRFFATAATLRAGAVRLAGRATGAFFAGASTGEHTTSESVDAFRTIGLWIARGTVSSLTTCAPADPGANANRPQTGANRPKTASREIFRIVKTRCLLIPG
jgi:hypothetical protein